jgi:penicillin-binding protein 2
MPMNESNPFPWRERGSRSFRVSKSLLPREAGREPEFFDHESLFEDEIIRLKDRSVFVGRGISQKRMTAVFFAAFIVFLGLLGRAGWMQIAQYDAYSERADENRFRSVALPARRGIIRDRNGVVLAENVPSFDVRVRWSDLPRSEEGRAQTISTIARTVGMTSEDILSILHATGTGVDEWVDVAKDISYERAIDLSVTLPDLAGVALVTSAKRLYPRSGETPSLSHVIGYVGSISPEEYEEREGMDYRRTDEIGKTGVERSYEDVIRGQAGEIRTEVDALGRFRAMVGERDPEDGNDVELTIDADLQEAAEEALEKGLELAKVTRGAVVVMDPSGGSVLSAVSWPAYDDNVFAGKVSSTAYGALVSDEDRPLFPRAWAGQFPSGSVIKPLIAAAALQEDVITAHTTVNSVGGISVGPWFFPDWSAGGHGLTDVRRALAWSVNTFFYCIGGGYDAFHGLGVVRLSQWMRNFGLGRALGLDVPGEASGFVPTREWKEESKGERWYIGDTYNLSIGQGDLLVTPLQIARMTATVANGGALVTPHVVRGDTVISDVLDVRPDVWETVRLGMRDAVTYGSARGLCGLPVAVAGKTGTAQWRSDRPNHAWFTGFAPYDKPEIVVTVLIEEGEEGSRYAVPIAGEIFRAWADSAGSAY